MISLRHICGVRRITEDLYEVIHEKMPAILVIDKTRGAVDVVVSNESPGNHVERRPVY